MHDKYLIADDFAYILGGRNTDNRFLGNYQEHYNVDRDILVYETEPGAGQSYQQLMNYFEAVWALPCCKVFKDSRCESDLAGCYEQTAQRYPEVFTDSLTTAEWESATLAAYSVELWSNPIEPENKTPILWARMVDAMAQDSDAAATAEGETSVAGETQNVSTGTGTAAANDDEVQDSTAATDGGTQDGITATGGKAQHGDTAATADSEMPATGETQTDTATESAAATAPQIPALMTEVTDSVYEAYAQKSDAFTGKLAGHDRLSRAEKRSADGSSFAEGVR